MRSLDEGKARRKRIVLKTAGWFHIVFSLINLLFPGFLMGLFGIDAAIDLMLWRGIALAIGILGIGYLVAAGNVKQHWLIVAVGLVGNVLTTAGFLVYAFSGQLPFMFGLVVLFTNVIWIPPFAFILKDAYDAAFKEDAYLVDLFSKQGEITLDMFETSDDMNLEEMSHKWPTMLVFLRHFGCTFCRETLSDLSEKRNLIEIKGTRIVIVHMSDEKTGNCMLKKYGLEDLPQVSDPELILYKMFRLKKGNIWQILGLKVLFRGFLSGLVMKYGVGKDENDDVHQMPGIFMLHKGKILSQYVHKTAADRPDYMALVRDVA